MPVKKAPAAKAKAPAKKEESSDEDDDDESEEEEPKKVRISASHQEVAGPHLCAHLHQLCASFRA